MQTVIVRVPRKYNVNQSNKSVYFFLSGHPCFSVSASITFSIPVSVCLSIFSSLPVPVCMVTDKLVLQVWVSACSTAYADSPTCTISHCSCSPDIRLSIQPILFCYPHSFLVVTTASGSVNSAFLHVDEKAQLSPHHNS